jgi:glycosyltransferase involved in cell wall biosynthesis
MSNLRIIQTPARFPPARGGVEKYVMELAKQLIAQGNEVVVVCADEPSVGSDVAKPVKAIRLPYRGKVANTNITIGLFSALMREDFDVIHTHIPTPWSADISALASLLKRKPLFVTYHNDLVGQGAATVIAGLYNWTFLHLVLWRAKEIFITQPRYIEYSRHLRLHRKKVSTIPLGVNNPLDVALDARVSEQVLFVSVLDKHHAYKGLDVLLEAIAGVKKQRPGVTLVVVGDGDLVPAYRTMARKLEIEDSVVFRGHVPDLELAKLYASSSLFALPSINRLEGFGIVALEALSYATPVITTPFAGSSQLILENDAGLVVLPRDVGMLTDAIVKLLVNGPDARKMGLRGAAAVNSLFGWDRVARQVADRYCASA